MEDQLIDLKNNQTMSSLEISKLTGKQHGHVMRDIKAALSELKINHSKYGSVYVGGNGEKRKMYCLPKYECDVVISGYSIKYRAAIIKRWQELESKEIKVLSPSEIALSSCRSIIALEKEQLELKRDQLQISKRVDRVEQIIGEKASNDKSPDPGYFSIGTMQVKFASKFPKVHVKGITLDSGTSVKIRSCECSKYIADKNATSEYIAYNFNDMNRVIDDLIKTGIRVGKTQKIKSPLYGSSFKHPIN